MNKAIVEPKPADKQTELLTALRVVQQQIPSIVLAAMTGTLTKENQFNFGQTIIELGEIIQRQVQTTAQQIPKSDADA